MKVKYTWGDKSVSPKQLQEKFSQSDLGFSVLLKGTIVFARMLPAGI